MALSRGRGGVVDAKVDPDQGVYVEIERIMEVRTSSENCDFEDFPEDMFDFQKRVREIPDDFCLKDKYTTEQRFFFCLVCNCDLKNLRPLRDHVTGNKHIRKAVERKREVLGLPKEPQNAPRKKEIKKERPRVDLGKSLKDLLMDCAEPALGLEWVTEYINPRDSRQHRMYTCSLDGCKSAWGTSDDMYNHVIKQKHLKNFFKKQYPEDERISGWNNATILEKACAEQEEQGGDEERDYTVIMQVRDEEKYRELRNRPDDWSEKKAQLGIVSNSNHEPLGQRKRRHSGRDREDGQEESPLFNEVDWADWSRPTRQETLHSLGSNFTEGVKDVRDMVDSFQGSKGDEKYEDIMFYHKIYSNLLSLFDNDLTSEAEKDTKTRLEDAKLELQKANDTLVDKVEGEDRAMKHVSQLMAELEDEIKNYHSDRSSKKYKNIQERIKGVTKATAELKPTRPANVERKAQINSRLAELWKEFEDRSESIVEILQRQQEEQSQAGQVARTSSQRRHKEKTVAVEQYKRDLLKFILSVLESEHQAMFRTTEERMKFSTKTIDNKIIGPELSKFASKGEAWSSFRVTEDTKQQIKKYLNLKLASK